MARCSFQASGCKTCQPCLGALDSGSRVRQDLRQETFTTLTRSCVTVTDCGRFPDLTVYSEPRPSAVQSVSTR